MIFVEAALWPVSPRAPATRRAYAAQWRRFEGGGRGPGDADPVRRARGGRARRRGPGRSAAIDPPEAPLSQASNAGRCPAFRYPLAVRMPAPPADTLCYGDCLDWMGRWDDATVDLIYLDPPFNSNANYNVLYARDSAGGAQTRAFVDTWSWDAAARRAPRALRGGRGSAGAPRDRRARADPRPVGDAGLPDVHGRADRADAPAVEANGVALLALRPHLEPLLEATARRGLRADDVSR